MIEPVRLTRTSRRGTASATAVVTGRVFLLEDQQYAQKVPSFVANDHSGLALCKQGSNTKIAAIADRLDMVLFSDPVGYTKLAAADTPFALPANDGGLFDSTLDDVLDGQRRSRATATVTPSRYVQAGDSPALKTLVRHAAAIERDDVIVTVPVALQWLTERQYLGQLIAALNRIPHPKALMFGAQNNPFDTAAATANFRHLLGETTNVGLWRADVPAAFDCIAHGGTFAAIGAGGSLRHLVPADEKPKANGPMIHTPAVFVPSMLRYVRGQVLAQKYANHTAPSCDCQVCDGASLDRFNSLKGEVRATAHAHNAAVWTNWLSALFDHETGADRQRWWKGVCQAAVDAHELENVRLRQKGAFTPSVSLKKLASLPLST